MAVFLAAMSSRVVTPLVKNRQQQKEFITSASHALKTPVTVIQADAQMLEAEAGENEWTAGILSQTRRMAEMTQRLVYLARLEEQDGSTEKLNFPLSDALQQVCDAFWGIAKEYGTQYSITIVPQIDFRGDEKAIRELMNVLLDNAFKYTPAGGGKSRWSPDAGATGAGSLPCYGVAAAVKKKGTNMKRKYLLLLAALSLLLVVFSGNEQKQIIASAENAAQI